MSRIGLKPISIPSGVTVTVADGQITIKGPKGELSARLEKGVKVEQIDDHIKVTRLNDLPATRAFHGLVRSLINNHIKGVSEGFKKTLKMVGTGYRVAVKGQGLTLSVGFSHPVEIPATDGVKLSIEGNDTIHIEGIDKQVVGQVAANIRKVRPPEPYKGKGIRYIDEEVIRKAGKTAAK